MQQPKRFQAPTLAEAYDKVRKELGGDAVILSTRKAYAPGLFGQPGRQFVEVVAHVPASRSLSAGRPTFDQDAAAHDLVRGVAEAVAMGGAEQPELAPPFANEFAGAAARLEGPFEALNADRARRVEHLEAPDAASVTALADMAALAQQIGQMRTLLEDLVTERSNARVDNGSPVLREMRDRLVRHGLSSAHVMALIGQAGESIVRTDDVDSVARTVERRLAAKLPPAPRVDLSRKPATVFLVGPSGAGKTTMAVRLALEVERAHHLRVAIAGTDVNRAGAPQQLIAFGAATGLDVRLCYAPADLQDLINSGEADVVVVDTPGHNGQRRDRMTEQSAYLQAAKRKSTLLVLPATTKPQDLSDIASAFGSAGIDGLVFTRCDETGSYGGLASVAIDAATGVAYTTHSDQVSDAPRFGDHVALAGAVVSGRWAAPASAPAAGSRRLAAAV